MARPRLKICCIASSREARIADAAGADLIGLVGPMPTGPGVVTLDQARAIASDAPLCARPILLTASRTADDIAADAATAGVDAVQVVRHIAPEEARALRDRRLRYVQVIHVENAGALALIDDYAEHCDAFLLDSGRPSIDAFGGTGRTHDWDVSAEFCRRAPKPVFLAGGLRPDNVAEAVRRVRPYGVDVCSGLRRDDALDEGLATAFVEAVRDVAAASFAAPRNGEPTP